MKPIYTLGCIHLKEDSFQQDIRLKFEEDISEV
jgi:hypothetical protein